MDILQIQENTFNEQLINFSGNLIDAEAGWKENLCQCGIISSLSKSCEAQDYLHILGSVM